MAAWRNTWANKLICDALRFLRDADGKASLSDVCEHLQGKDYIPEGKRAINNAGIPKWQQRLNYMAGFFIAAGALQDAKGVWSITPAGQTILGGKIPDKKIVEWAYSRWEALKTEQPLAIPQQSDVADESDDNAPTGGGIKAYYSSAYKGISQQIESLNPFVFQNLVAALFRGMGYYVRDVSPQNTADGGIDVVAYQGGDALGVKAPRIKAQVKHQQSKTGRPELQKLLGAMNDGDVGVFISTGGFAGGCREFAKQQNRQLELIDMPRFIELWRDNYDKLSDEDKSLLPLQPIYFLDEERAKRS